MIGEMIRKYGFWIIDYLKNNPVRDHYNEITKIMNNYSSKEDIEIKKLNDLLDYAVKNSKFYMEYNGFTSIKNFPIIDKNIIKKNEDNILSIGYKNKHLKTMSTSGSTGTPFTIKQNSDKRNRVLAEIIYFGEICNYYLGDRNAYLRVWTEENKKSFLGALKQNLVMLDISNGEEEGLEKIRNILKNDKKLKVILGYANSLDIISRYMLSKGDNPSMFNIDVIISQSEILKDSTRENLKGLFGCNVVSRYSNQENGIIAQEPIGEKFFIINNASYFIEFLKLDSEEEASFGELSRIVITDLFNYSMPMIRYDTGDLAIVEKNHKYGKVITSIEGRKRDFIYNTKGNIISPSAITVNMWNYKEIDQFQLIQEDKKIYTFKLNGAKGIYEDYQIINKFKSVLGQDANIYIEHVNEIPQLRSGKFQTTICKYKKEN